MNPDHATRLLRALLVLTTTEITREPTRPTTLGASSGKRFRTSHHPGTPG